MVGDEILSWAANTIEDLDPHGVGIHPDELAKAAQGLTPKWSNIETHQPEIGQYCIVTSKRHKVGFCVEIYSGSADMWIALGHSLWMPIVEPPKD